MAIGTPTVGTLTTSGSGTSLSVPYPASVGAGDQLVLCGAGNQVGSPFTTPSGWTLVSSLNGPGNASPGVGLAIKTAAGTEGGTSLTVASTDTQRAYQILAFPGVDATTPQDATASTYSPPGDRQYAALPSITLATAGAALFIVSGIGKTGRTATPPAGYTETGEGGPSFISMETAYILGQPVGATGTQNVDWVAVDGYPVGIMLALRPAATAATLDGAAAFTATSTLTATGFKTVAGAASLTATSTLTAAGTLGGVQSGAAAFTATSTFTAGATKTQLGVVALSTTSTLTAAATVTGIPVATVPSWDGGIQVATSGTASWDPPVEAPPAAVAEAIAQRIVAVEAIDSVTVAGTEVFPVTRSANKPYARHRIVVGGKDVTYFRGVVTPMPTYGLVSPLLYGSGMVTFPQIHAAYEQPGTGALAWLRKFASVKVQRVDAGGSVVSTDYRGFIADFQRSGRDLSCTLGGEATGLAAMSDHDLPIFAPERDAGAIAMQLVQHHLRLPVGGVPDTGIMLTEQGGDSELSVLTNLLALTTQRDGTQWTIMPNSSGTYRMFQKDTTTIAASVYIDGFRVAQDLRRDFTEEPNRIWASGVGPDGLRVNFAIYPGLASTARPAFPGTLSPGDSSAGVIALIYRLFTVGYLDVRVGVWTTAGDDPVTDAVKDLQDDAGLTRTGVVNTATWNALFDPDVTGYTLRRSQIKPAAQWSYTQAVLRTASGQVIKPNPKYDRSKPFVDATVDMGAGWTRRRMQKWAQHELANNSESPNWVGTIIINMGAVIDGTHNPSGALATGDVRDARSLEPGMNLWLSNWDGGTLVHIAGVQVSEGSVELTVDTRARDTMKVWQVLARNRESRKHPDRQWLASNRRSAQRDDTAAFYDGSTFGKIEPVYCPANQWTVVPTPAGRSGTIQTVNLNTHDSQALFVAAAFGKEIDAAKLSTLIGDPLTKDGTKAWQDKAVTLHDDHYLAWAFGGKEDTDTYGQYCGYWPKHVTGKTVTTTRTGTADAGTNRITVTSHDYSEGSRVTIGGTVPGGLSSTTYYVRNVSGDTFELSSSETGGIMDITGDASGVSVSRSYPDPPPPVTGDFRDQAGVPYFCKGAPVLWLAIYPDRNTTLSGGRVLELLLDDAAA